MSQKTQKENKNPNYEGLGKKKNSFKTDIWTNPVSKCYNLRYLFNLT